MKVRSEKLYHIYNQGNNRQPIFFEQRNYFYFLRKIRKYLLPHLHVLAYCLMPNHFHFLIYPKSGFESQQFSQDVKTLLSSYTRGINKQENRSGSLFRQNSKAKLVAERDYGLTCFRYIYQNPIKDAIVGNLLEWKFSSLRDYLGLRKGTLCNKQLAFELLELPKSKKDLKNFIHKDISERDLEEIF